MLRTHITARLDRSAPVAPPAPRPPVDPLTTVARWASSGELTWSQAQDLQVLDADTAWRWRAPARWRWSRRARCRG